MYKLLSTDFYVVTGSEMSWTITELIFENNLSNIVPLKHNVNLNFCSLPLGAKYSFSDLVRMKNIFIPDSGRKTYKGFPSFALSDR